MENKESNYFIAKKTDTDQLQRYVKDLMFIGYKPVGGLLFAQGYFMQALIK